MSNLQLRVISAVILAAIVLILTWIGGLPFRLLAIVIAAAMFYEWVSMTRGGLKISPFMPYCAFGLSMLVLFWMPNVLIVLMAIILPAAIAALFAETRGQGIWVAKGFLYAAASGLALSYLRGDSDAGLIAILFLFAVVWATDIAAYFVGRAFGGPKLALTISPGKTWSGAIGGTTGGIAAGMTIGALSGEASYGLFVTAVLLSVVAQIGDLFESSVKRFAGIKDSSNLIPGHGGVMDRVDGLVVAAMALYVIGALAGHPDQPALALF
ncbi:MAG: phosphatidate cytidylyltransferase [Rhizobiaceae bacterium]